MAEVTVYFTPMIEGDKTVYETVVQAKDRVGAVLAWQAFMTAEGVHPDDFQVVGIKGLPNTWGRRFEDEERRRGR